MSTERVSVKLHHLVRIRAICYGRHRVANEQYSEKKHWHPFIILSPIDMHVGCRTHLPDV